MDVSRFWKFKSTSMTLNGNISDVHLKYDIIYKSIGFLSIPHAVTSCTVSFNQISEYQKKTSEIWTSQWMGRPQKNSLTEDFWIRNYLKIITTTSPEFFTWKVKKNKPWTFSLNPLSASDAPIWCPHINRVKKINETYWIFVVPQTAQKLSQKSSNNQKF